MSPSTYVTEFFTWLSRLNLFYNAHKSSEKTLHREHRSTRIYLLLLATGLIILALYNALDKEVNIVNVQEPTLAIYQRLVRDHDIAASIRCPCARVSVRYSSFLQVTTVLHQVCSSVFVQTSWIESFMNSSDWQTVPITDFRIQGFNFFLSLSSMCAIAIDQVSTATNCFSNHQLNNAELIPHAQLFFKTDGENEPMRQWYTRTFMNKLQFTLDLIQVNQLMTLYLSNWSMRVNDTASTYSNIPLPSPSAFYGSTNCSCATSKVCTQPMLLKEEIIPGMVMGCIPMESILRSTLVCLYNQSCVDRINVARLETISPLVNVSLLQSVYATDSTVKGLFQEIFLEQWLINTSYADYYKECAPTSCFYSIFVKNNPLSVILSLLSLYGGLTVALRFLVPRLVGLSSRVATILLQSTKRVHPSTIPSP